MYATVLTHWLKLALQIINWNNIGMVWIMHCYCESTMCNDNDFNFICNINANMYVLYTRISKWNISLYIKKYLPYFIRLWCSRRNKCIMFYAFSCHDIDIFKLVYSYLGLTQSQSNPVSDINNFFHMCPYPGQHPCPHPYACAWACPWAWTHTRTR
jgi:hypothetical protein